MADNIFQKRRPAAIPPFDANAFDALVTDSLNVGGSTFKKPRPVKPFAPKQDFDPVGYINGQGPADDEKSAF